MIDKQKKLKEFYSNKFFNNSTIPMEYSSPHLISLDVNKINTNIMIVGQETNSWYGDYSDFKQRGVESQMKIYSDFMNEKYDSMNSLFWKWVKTITNDNSIIPVWTNLFKFDLGDSAKYRNISKASKEEYQQIIKFHRGVLAKEIEIIKPKIIVFFTGSPYDKLFFDPIVIQDNDYRTFYKSIDELSNINEWKCAKLQLKDFEGFESFAGQAIRTYHPMYLNRQYKNFGHKVQQYLISQVTKQLK